MLNFPMSERFQFHLHKQNMWFRKQCVFQMLYFQCLSVYEFICPSKNYSFAKVTFPKCCIFQCLIVFDFICPSKNYTFEKVIFSKPSIFQRLSVFDFIWARKIRVSVISERFSWFYWHLKKNGPFNSYYIYIYIHMAICNMGGSAPLNSHFHFTEDPPIRRDQFLAGGRFSRSQPLHNSERQIDDFPALRGAGAAIREGQNCELRVPIYAPPQFAKFQG